MRCALCHQPIRETPMALRDYETEEGPYDLPCSLELLAEAQSAEDAGALHVRPWHCAERTWIESGGTDRHRADNPPGWVMDERVWTEAKEAVAQRWDDYQNPWAVVVDVYKAKGGRVR